MEQVKYLLFESNFNVGESELYRLGRIESIKDFFCGDEAALGHLLESGSYYGEWFHYHLICLADFK